MGAWSPIPHPYEKYIYENPNDYTSVDPNLIKSALDSAGLSPDNTDALFSSWQSSMGINPSATGASPSSTSGATPPAPVDWKSLIASDPAYQQEQADFNAGGIADAATRAALIRRSIASWGLLPDFNDPNNTLGLSPDTLNYIKSDVDPNTVALAQANENQGLSMHAKLAKANEDNLRGIRNALAARGMYQSGELGYGLDENARQYKDASTTAMQQVLGQIEDASGRYAASEKDRTRARGDSLSAAADRAVTRAGSTPAGTTAAGGTTSGVSSFVLPAKTASVWDVNTASTYDGINAAKRSGGGIVIRPDDPESMTKANAAAQAGVPVSIQVNGDANDTPATLASRIAGFQRQYPGASFTLDLESPNFRGGPGTPGYTQMQEYAQQVMQTAGNTPITISTEGVSDFNYGAWASNPNVTFMPMAYDNNMNPTRSVQDTVNILVAQGIDPSRIVPVVAPGQDLGGYTGPVSVYGAPHSDTPASAAPAAPSTQPYANTPVGAAQQNAATSAPNYSPETIQKILSAVAQAYSSPVMDSTLRTGGMY